MKGTLAALGAVVVGVPIIFADDFGSYILGGTMGLVVGGTAWAKSRRDRKVTR